MDKFPVRNDGWCLLHARIIQQADSRSFEGLVSACHSGKLFASVTISRFNFDKPMKLRPITTALVLGKQAILFLLVGLSVWGATARAVAPSRIPLAGPWRFEIAGADANAFTRELTGTIRLPGTMDDAGLGEKNKAEPDLSGPYRTYNHVGPAWYQRDIEIPAAWQGQHITLLLERVRWTTRVWLDDKPLGMQDSLIAPHLYELGTAATPGRHRLTICVDNSVKINLGPIVSALAGGVPGNMNGIIGRIELAATPPVWIADVQVYPDVDKKPVQTRFVKFEAIRGFGDGPQANLAEIDLLK